MPTTGKEHIVLLENLSELFENMLNGFALHQIVLNKKSKPVDYIFLDVNSAFENLTGLKRKDIIGKEVTSVIPGIENDHADWISKYGEVAIKGKSIVFENYSEPLNKWFSISAYSPKQGYFATIFEDITEKKESEKLLQKNSEEIAAQNEELETQNEEFVALNEELKMSIDQLTEANQKLRESEDLLSRMSLMAKVGGWEFDALTGEGTWTNEVARIHGMTPEEYTNRDIGVEFYLPSSREKIQKAIKEVLNGVSYDLELEFKAADGKKKWVRTIGHPVYEGSKVVKVAGSFQDITERKEQEAKLLETKLFYESIIEGVQDGIWVSDKNDVIYYANYAMAEIAGIPVEKIIGNNVLTSFGETVIKNFKKYYHEAKKSLEPTWYEVFMKTPSGKDTWQNGWLIPKIRKGKYDGMITTTRDITDRKMTENELIRYREDLEDLVKERTRELEEKNKELEDFNRLFVGREFRINELKEKIKELKEQLEER